MGKKSLEGKQSQSHTATTATAAYNVRRGNIGQITFIIYMKQNLY